MTTATATPTLGEQLTAKLKETPVPKGNGKQADMLFGAQHDIPDVVDPLLVTILSWPRKHGSVTEGAFMTWLNGYILEITGKLPTVHQVGSISVTVPFEPKEGQAPGVITPPSTTLFSCHCDTIDAFITDPATRKKLTYDPNFGLIGLDTTSPGDSLGADDGVGVWLMLNMIFNKVPGTYLFHRGEEMGGISAKANATHGLTSQWLKQFECCVAFDRPRDSEIITHQRGGTECASEKFGMALAERLNEYGFGYKTSKSGVYTDNYEYRGLIAECVNVGVGYTDQHGRRETLDYGHAFALRNAVVDLAWDALPVDRDPTKKDPVPQYPRYDWQKDGHYGVGGFHGLEDRDYDDGFKPAKVTKISKKIKTTLGRINPKDKMPVTPSLFREPTFDPMGMTYDDLRCMCEDDPDASYQALIDLIRENARLKADIDTMTQLLGDY